MTARISSKVNKLSIVIFIALAVLFIIPFAAVQLSVIDNERPIFIVKDTILTVGDVFSIFWLTSISATIATFIVTSVTKRNKIQK